VKLSVPLIPQPNGEFPRSPWHCSIAVGLDGTYRTVHSKDVRESHNLILQHGRPYFFREKSDLWDWGTDEVAFRPLYLRGVVVAPTRGFSGRSLTEGEVDKLNQLAQLQPVRADGFTNTPSCYT
jgi:hypothetical protein